LDVPTDGGAHDVLGDFLSQFLLLLFGFAGPEVYDD
jgi:hypothetical protein